MKYGWLILLWAGFGVSHSYLISEGFIRWIRQSLGKYYSSYRLAYNIISVASFLPLLYYTKQIDTYQVIAVNPILQIILVSLSASVITWAFFTFDSLEFLGLRQLMDFNDDGRTNREAKPVRSGLYSLVRHPMYTATILLMWCLNSTLAEIIAKVILTIYLIVGAFLEERKLLKEFGDSYVEYKKEVPMLIPFIKLVGR